MDTRLGNCRRRYLSMHGWAIAFLLSAFVAGCGGGGGDGGATDGGSGTLGVALTDAPACGFDAVNVSVTRVRVHRGGTDSASAGGWSEITLNPARKINLLDLTNGVLEYLGETELPAGHYTQVRLLLAPNDPSRPFSNSVVLSSNPGAEIALRTPSAVQTGIKLIHGFNVAPGQRTDLVLDFDACKSVVALGNGGFLLKPVIKVIPTELNGINGFVDLTLLGSNVLVSAQVDGAVVRATVPDTSTGAFFLARLAPGTYDVVITADGRATAVIGSVPVATATSIVAISGQAESIVLPPSATREINGNVRLDPVSTTEEPVFVSARQTFGGDLTVTVKSRVADLLSGDYTLTLPTAAPLLGQYMVGGTPPIPLVAQPGLAGQYAVEASSIGYQAQSFDQNISAGDATSDFVLIP
jgi:hypothetical protein